MQKVVLALKNWFQPVSGVQSTCLLVEIHNSRGLVTQQPTSIVGSWYVPCHYLTVWNKQTKEKTTHLLYLQKMISMGIITIDCHTHKCNRNSASEYRSIYFGFHNSNNGTTGRDEKWSRGRLWKVPLSASTSLLTSINCNFWTLHMSTSAFWKLIYFSSLN